VPDAAIDLGQYEPPGSVAEAQKLELIARVSRVRRREFYEATRHNPAAVSSFLAGSVQHCDGTTAAA
jgi:hypothetical protein